MADHHEVDGARTRGGRTNGRNGEKTGSGEWRTQTLLLNSKRLTASVLRQLAGGLGVPTPATQADLRPMIEGKLTKSGWASQSTQVVLCKVPGTHLSLHDETGVFAELSLRSRNNLLLPRRVKITVRLKKTWRSQGS